jgi:methionyl-tRNA formyltransferase
MHAGITPRYRGVHGGYWALAEHHPDWVGTTVHLVDPGIDTGSILGQVTFQVSRQDTIATYPDLQLAHGLPLLAAQTDRVMAGLDLEPLPTSVATGTGLYYHPTLWGYLWRRLRYGVR